MCLAGSIFSDSHNTEFILSEARTTVNVNRGIVQRSAGMSREARPTGKKTVITSRVTCTCFCVTMLWCWTAEMPAQESHERINQLIAQLESEEAAIVGEDWEFIDMEHTPYLLDRLADRLAALKPNAAVTPLRTPLVRIPMEGDESFRFAVKQVLDMGAFGIVFPRIETRAQAERAIRAMRYPPQRGEAERVPVGVRGWGPGRAARYWGLSVSEYVRKADVWPLDPDGELFAMMMIESAEGVANAADIATVPGIGALFIGPVDLTMSLGVGPPGPMLAPETEAAIQSVLRVCRTTQIICGLAEGSGQAAKRIEEGFRVLLVF